MRKCSLTLLLLGLFHFSYNQVVFDNSSTSWIEVLQKAKQHNKPVFVDVYTEWCGPCKLMDKNIFTQKDVGDFYNQNFISIKLDAEKSYGIGFAKSNGINAYPTYLYFSPTGYRA
jgi:thiol:disulfide interchange protein